MAATIDIFNIGIFIVSIFKLRSIHNKSHSIVNWIISQQLSVTGVAETWHDTRDRLHAVPRPLAT